MALRGGGNPRQIARIKRTSRSGERYKVPAAAESPDQGVKRSAVARSWRVRGVPTPVRSRMSRPRLAPQTCTSSRLSTLECPGRWTWRNRPVSCAPAGAAVLHAGDLRFRILQMRTNRRLDPFFRALAVEAGQLGARRCRHAGGLGQSAQERLVALARVPAHDASQRGVGVQRRRIDAHRLASDQTGVGQMLQHPREDRLVRLQVDPPSRSRYRRMVRRRLVQRNVQTLPQAQRIGRPPTRSPVLSPGPRSSRATASGRSGPAPDSAGPPRRRRTSRTCARRRCRNPPRRGHHSIVHRTGALRLAAGRRWPPTSTVAARNGGVCPLPWAGV